MTERHLSDVWSGAHETAVAPRIMAAVSTSWSIPGAEGNLIFGNTNAPDGRMSGWGGSIVIAHGFKGYKDYGMFPRLAREFAARGGLVAQRFNFSHSGITNRLDTFERPDLFERDTWSKQVFDLTAVLQAIAHGKLPGSDRLKPQASSPKPPKPPKPLFVLGHSRGGVTALLTAARLTELGRLPDLAGVITLAAPSSCNPFSLEEAALLLDQGWIESPSSRTGQRLRVGRAFLQEQLDDPAAHDLLPRVSRIRCPMLIIHGASDPTVPVQCADDLARAAGNRATLHIVPGGDHVFNTSNPLPEDQPSSPQLAEVIDAVLRFTTEITENTERA